MRFQFLPILLVIALLAAVSPTTNAQEVDQDYVLGVGDALNIQVFGEPDLSFDALPVVDDGVIVMPLIGDVSVAGMSVRNAQSEIRRRLADGYLINPQVTVTISDYRPVFVVGEVKNPGKVPYTVGMTVRNAVVLAGGITDEGNRNNIVIERLLRGAETFPADFSSEIRPGDTVNVGRTDTFAVRGAVQFPETLKYQPDLTLQKAIDLAGGFAEDSDNNSIKLERDGKVFDVAGSLEQITIEPDDILTVGKLSQQEKDQLHVFVKGEVARGGRYEYADGMTVEKAITMAGGFSERASRRKIEIRRDGDPPVLMKRVDLTDYVLPGDIITVGASIF